MIPASVNIILFEPDESKLPLPRADARSVHILEILKRRVGDTFDAGVIDGPRGKATLADIGHDGLRLEFTWGSPPPPLDPLTLIVGLPRPQTARKILQEASALGVGSMRFVRTDRGEPSYASSTLWSSGEWRRHLRDGAAQAFCTRLPDFRHGGTLAEEIAGSPAGALRLALDNYESSRALADALRGHAADVRPGLVLVIGSERGWSAPERTLLRAEGFTLVHLGARVLRTETATVAAVAVVKATLGWL